MDVNLASIPILKPYCYSQLLCCEQVDALDADGDTILGYTLVDYSPSETTTKFTFNTASE